MRKVVFGLCMFALVAVFALAQDVSVDYNHKAPFNDYKTYKWLRPVHMADPLMDHRVTDAINSQLQAKGLQEVNDGADIGIVANGATHTQHNLQTFYDGMGGWGWWGWGAPGMATTQEENYEVGTLVVDVFDCRTKQVVWRGIAKGTLSDKPEKNTAKLDKAIEKMFDHFPK
jgi:hypothetical protein